MPIIAGIGDSLESVEEVLAVAEEIGFPVMLQASNGGGGRGMRIVHSAADMPR